MEPTTTPTLPPPMPAGAAPSASTADLVALITQFEGTPEQFLLQVLAFQCRLTGALGAAVVRAVPAAKPQDAPVAPDAEEQDDAEAQPQWQFQVLASYPPIKPGTAPPQWLSAGAEAMGSLLEAAEPVASALVEPQSDPDAVGMGFEQDPSYLVLVPLRVGKPEQGVAVFFLRELGERQRAQTTKLLELCAAMLCAYEMRLALQQRQQAMQIVQRGLDVLGGINTQHKLNAAAMALVNEVAGRFGAERVSLGFLLGRYVKVRAISHTEKVNRKMKLVQELEAVMEECLDQDVEVLHPPPQGASYVSRAAGELNGKYGPMNICSLPLRKDRQVQAVLTVERAKEKPFRGDDVQTLRLVCELCTARLLDLHEHDRWFGARWVTSARRGIKALAGPKHTWWKVGFVAAVLFLLGATFLKGTYKVEAPFVIEAVTRQVVAAPFDGEIKLVNVEVGDTVTAGQTVLAEMKTDKLLGEIAAATADMARFQKQAELARQENKPSEAEIARHQMEQARARRDLLQYELRRAKLVAPIDGIVVVGDLKKRQGGPTQTGEVLFEIAPLDAMRAELKVPDDRIADVALGATGELAAASHPGSYLRFEVERIHPVAEVDSGGNVFPVRVKLLDAPPPGVELSPGVAGVAKVHAGEMAYLKIWTRDLVNWVRMKLWI